MQNFDAHLAIDYASFVAFPNVYTFIYEKMKPWQRTVDKILPLKNSKPFKILQKYKKKFSKEIPNCNGRQAPKFMSCFFK